MKRLLDKADARLKRALEAQRKAEEDLQFRKASAELQWYADHREAIIAGWTSQQMDMQNMGAQFNSIPLTSTGTGGASIVAEEDEEEALMTTAQDIAASRITSRPPTLATEVATDLAVEEPFRASWWTAGTARGSFTLKINNYGGKLYTTRGIVNSADFAGIVDDALSRGERVNILTGVHGNVNGHLSGELEFKIWDVARFNRPGVTIWNMDTMMTEEITDVLNSTETTIGAFCYSGSCLSPYMTP